MATQFLIAFCLMSVVSKVYKEEFHAQGIEKKILILLSPMMVVSDFCLLFGYFNEEFSGDVGKSACKTRYALRQELEKNREPTLKEKFESEIQAELKKKKEAASKKKK